ncbi:cell wall protein [Streptomyces sp. DH18]|uniref:cell wall protein n=1 Tax=Streptomyces sp. DH18 TaxID=3040126 RepID=UPI00244205AB|nr:cell wall protein [Streptomyces sp. DH18]MDG9687727.1 cell wall protein [Streptomyces sp. DH18]
MSAGLHPGAGPSTVMVAEDLAGRMDYRRGIAIYDLDGIVRRTGLSRATVKRHIRVLRELGSLVWLVHGSKRNIAAPGEGYMATATIYGVVIPPAYDDAMGHRLDGTGYQARVCGVTPAGRELAVAASAARSVDRGATGRRTQRSRPEVRWTRTSRGTEVRPVDNPAVDNSCSGGREPHSPGSYHRRPAVNVESGCKDTSRKRASLSTTSPSPEKRSNGRPATRRTARQVQRGIWITRQVRARVNWTQGVRLRRLEYVLRPLLDAGLDADTIAAELHSWMLTWRPARPAEYIHARLAQQATAQHVVTMTDIAEGWDEQEASGALGASRPELVLDVMEGLAAGMAAYSAHQAEQGLDDLTDASAAADMAAFLSAGVPA